MVEGRISEREYVAAVALHQSKYTKAALAACSVSLAFGLLVWGLDGPMALSGLLAGAGIGGMVGHWLWDRLYVPRRAAKLYRQSADFAAPFRISWNRDAVEISAPNGSWRRQWVEFVRRRENDELVLLYINDQLFNLFPRRLFESEANWSSFRECAIRVPT